jgi:hypothetical protein
MIRQLIIILLLVPLLGCLEPVNLVFESEPRILRGTWSSTAWSEFKLRLVVTATYIDKTSYTVAGTAQFDEQTPISITGIMQGYDTERYLLQTPAIRPARVVFTFIQNQVTQELICYNPQPGSMGARYECRYSDSGKRAELEKQ